MLRFLTLIVQIAILFIVYYIGTWIQQLLQLSIPGSVMGFILMFILLVTGIFPLRWIEQGASFMIKHLVLFFIPATVGILNYYTLFKGKGLLLFIITIVSTLLVMIISGLVSQKIAFARERKLENE